MSGGRIREADGRGPPRPPPCYDGSNANVAANSLLGGGGTWHDNVERGLFRVEGGGGGEIDEDDDDSGDGLDAVCVRAAKHGTWYSHGQFG